MLKPIDEYFLYQDEPVKSCLEALRELILWQDENITEAWKYRMPFYCYREKMCFYLWIDKKSHQPYIGIVNGKSIDHPDLLLEKRAKMKILLIDPNADIPVKKINDILAASIALLQLQQSSV